jgi:hypothetical protein
VSLYGTEDQMQQAETLLNSIIKLGTEYLKRVSHPEPGMSPKKYYKDLIDKFTAQAQEIIDQIGA